eukprot:1944830-Rhodomonas_salina.3
MSGTDLAYAASELYTFDVSLVSFALSPYALPMPCPGGTDDRVRLWVQDTWVPPLPPPTRVLLNDRYSLSVLRTRPRLSSSPLVVSPLSAYGRAMRYPVLKERMPLPAYGFPMRCPVLAWPLPHSTSYATLGLCYAMSGTDLRAGTRSAH